MQKLPAPPYYAVIFTSTMNKNEEGYSEMADKMLNLAKEQPGYLGFESARSEIGISVSYWKDLESIRNWKKNTDHILAQRMGKNKWYNSYSVKISRIERVYDFNS